MGIQQKKRRFSAGIGADRLAAAVVLCALAGCAAERTAVEREPSMAPARWEAVVLPERTAARVEEMNGAWGPAWWDGRRDGELAVREVGPLLATDEWPEADRPSMDQSRYMTLPSRPETILYFRPEYRRGPGW